MRRREFITLLGGAATWPFAASAQEGARMRRIGVLMSQATDDPIAHARNAAFLQGLQELGWTVAQNVQLEYRWGPRSRCNKSSRYKKGPDGAWYTSRPESVALTGMRQNLLTACRRGQGQGPSRNCVPLHAINASGSNVDVNANTAASRRPTLSTFCA